MRLTEIGDKEIVDRRSYLKEDLQLPWKSIIIVGEDTIIFQSC